MPRKTKSVPSKAPEPSRPEGRPTKYEASYCDSLLSHMALGYSFESFAGRIGVHRDTLYEWLKHHPEFSDAKKVGTEKSRLIWEGMGLRAASGNAPKGFNAAVYIFTMKNKFKWTDRVELSSDPENPMGVSPIERQKIDDILGNVSSIIEEVRAFRDADNATA